jgi:hypothetical protein
LRQREKVKEFNEAVLEKGLWMGRGTGVQEGTLLQLTNV